MERLTRRDETGDAIISALSDMTADLYTGLGDNEQFLTDALNKLAAYEDAEEQGRLVVLPCRVGDVLFVTDEQTILPARRTVESITWWNGEISIRAVNDRTGYAYFCKSEDFGKTVFLNREEAEKALEGMNNG